MDVTIVVGLVEEGEILVQGEALNYTYEILEDNRNERSIMKPSTMRTSGYGVRSRRHQPLSKGGTQISVNMRILVAQVRLSLGSRFAHWTELSISSNGIGSRQKIIFLVSLTIIFCSTAPVERFFRRSDSFRRIRI